MTSLSHMAISASAGSGKTFQLADRFVRLLAGGVPPDRIAALTFSRKAAGEIFDRIVAHLCEACRSPAHATAVAKRIGLADTDSAAFVAALRTLVDRLPRLHIGTLDSFIVGVLRAFPTELGVPPDFQMLDENSADATRMRERVLDRICNPLAMDDAIQGQFFEAFKQATFGTEEKDMERSLHRFVQAFRNLYQVLPEADGWGVEHRIWPQGSPWLTPTRDVTRAATALTEHIRAHNWPAKFEEGLLRIVATAASHTPSSRWEGALSRNTIMIRIMEQLDALAVGKLEIDYSRKSYALNLEMCGHLLTVLRHMLGIELRGALRRTAGIHRLLDLFETHYDALMRRSGSMTFADAQHLLTEANRYSNAACLSRMADVEGRLYIDYRLDCKLDHWLLDEFQDTSDLQWAVLRNLVDEILQDSGNERSFFYVGDIKQAIYGWRGGNPYLFGEILSTYGDRIRELPLATSYRSAPPVIDTVNAIFSALPADRLPAAAIEQWQTTWHPHDCAPHLRAAAGFATIVEPPCPPDRNKPTATDRYDVVAALLREIRPVKRGLETAILVRRNDTGHLLVELLRRACPAIPVTHEGKAGLRQNGLTELLLALLAYAAHPGDTMAWRHIWMSPLADYLAAQQLDALSLPRRLNREIGTLGFAEFIRTWSQRLDAVAPLDAFARHCLNDLVDAAVQFDRSCERDPDAFRRFIDSYELGAAPTPGAVRVMTIHQSKGLGFDIVILPELDGNDITRNTRRSVLLHRAPDMRRPDWVLALPNRMVADADTVLTRATAEADAESCFEDLCVLYVAATRARHGLYAVTSYAGPSATSFTAAELLKHRLVDCEDAITIDDTPATQLYARGRRDWYADHAAPTTPGVPSPPPVAAEPGLGPRLAPLQRLEPSGGDTTPRGAAWLFTETAHEVLQFGSAIHALFEQIEWIEDADADALVERWQSMTDVSGKVARDAVAQFRYAFAQPEVQAALARPDQPVQLWREKRFHFIQDDRLVSGVFDRVTVTIINAAPAAATILDYKSDQVESEAKLQAAVGRHRDQLNLYRNALSHILSIPRDTIACRLLFSRPGRVITVAPPS